MILGPTKEFTIKDRKLKRQVCWLTNSDCIAQEIMQGTGEKVMKSVKKGLNRQLVEDRRMNEVTGGDISFMIDEEDWDPESDTAWDDVTGKTLDRRKVEIARKEEIQ